MKRLIHPSSFLMYFLSLMVFFMAGMTYAGLTGAAKGQGLAGGAIVLFYGISFALVALIVSFFLVYYLDRFQIKLINKILVALFAGFVVYLSFRIMNKERNSETGQSQVQVPVSLAADLSTDEPPMGIGIVKPAYHEHPVIYFYGPPEFRKSIMEHSPYDSLVMSTSETGLAVKYAPPWLVPEYMKLDYEMLHFKAISLGEDFIEIEVNKYEQRTAFADKRKVIFMYWPEFLLQVHSVEQIEPQNYPVRIKPLSRASPVTGEYAFLIPVLIRDQWMKVEMVSESYEKTGEGWIQWKKEGKLLIRYSLLS